VVIILFIIIIQLPHWYD